MGKTLPTFRLVAPKNGKGIINKKCFFLILVNILQKNIHTLT